MPKKILVTGASVAGNTVAWWLTRFGCNVTVVERAPAFRGGGQNVDVKEPATTVVRRMGLLEAVRARGTGETGLAFVDEANHAFATFGVGEALTADLEILRDDLAHLIFEGARDRARYRFGDAIRTVESESAGASVVFDSGAQERFDAVIVAEGVGSSTRERVFPGENKPRFLDMTIAYFTMAKGATDSALARAYATGTGCSVLLRPDRQGTTRAFLMVQGAPDHVERPTREAQQRFFAERFAGAGWECERVLAGMRDSADFYYDVLRQNRMARWSDGAIVLTGDAAWCATPLAGMGSSLAIIGGYVLAGEISRDQPLAQAFAGYERIMRPIIERYGPAPKIVPRLLHPRTRAGRAVLRGLVELLATPAAKAIGARLSGDSKAAPGLPDYALPPSR